jgi:hypothetical protein
MQRRSERCTSVSVLLPTALAVAALAVAAGLVAPQAALAEIEGPCQGTVAGQNVATHDTSATGEPIKVREKARIPVTMSSARPITSLTVELEFGGLGWTVHDEPTEGTSWARTVDVGDYSKYGVGLYKVVATSSGQGFSCTGATLVEVDGSPLSTVAGLVGIGLAVVGGLGVLWVAIRGPGGAPVVGMILGVVLGAGVGVLLQQFSIVYPTMIAALIALGGGAALGLLMGLFGQRGRPRY